MSLPTIAAARVLKGQKAGRSGVGEQMLYEAFPNVGLARVSSELPSDSWSAWTCDWFFAVIYEQRYEYINVIENKNDSIKYRIMVTKYSHKYLVLGFNYSLVLDV